MSLSVNNYLGSGSYLKIKFFVEHSKYKKILQSITQHGQENASHEFSVKNSSRVTKFIDKVSALSLPFRRVNHVVSRILKRDGQVKVTVRSKAIKDLQSLDQFEREKLKFFLNRLFENEDIENYDALISKINGLIDNPNLEPNSLLSLSNDLKEHAREFVGRLVDLQCLSQEEIETMMLKVCPKIMECANIAEKSYREYIRFEEYHKIEDALDQILGEYSMQDITCSHIKKDFSHLFHNMSDQLIDRLIIRVFLKHLKAEENSPYETEKYGFLKRFLSSREQRLINNYKDLVALFGNKVAAGISRFEWDSFAHNPSNIKIIAKHLEMCVQYLLFEYFGEDVLKSLSEKELSDIISTICPKLKDIINYAEGFVEEYKKVEEYIIDIYQGEVIPKNYEELKAAVFQKNEKWKFLTDKVFENLLRLNFEQKSEDLRFFESLSIRSVETKKRRKSILKSPRDTSEQRVSFDPKPQYFEFI